MWYYYMLRIFCFCVASWEKKSKLYGLVSALSSCKKSNLTMSRIKQIELYSQFGEHNSWKVKLVAKNNSEAITWYIPKKKSKSKLKVTFMLFVLRNINSGPMLISGVVILISPIQGYIIIFNVRDSRTDICICTWYAKSHPIPPLARTVLEHRIYM